LGMIGLIFVLPVFLQSVRGLDAFHTGLSLLPMSATVLIAAPMSAFFSKHFTAKRIIQTGLLLNFFAAVGLHFLIGPNATSWTLAPGLVVYGLGMGMVMAQVSNLTLSAVSVQQAGEASGVNNTMRQVGSTLGSAILGAILLGAVISNMTAGVRNSQIIPEKIKPQVESAVAAHSSAVEFGGGAAFSGNLPARLRQNITDLSHDATAEAARLTMLATAGFALLAFFFSFLLPNVKNLEREQSAAAHH